MVALDLRANCRKEKTPLGGGAKLENSCNGAHARGQGRPWAEMGKSGKPLTQAKLARMLKPLGISPGNIGEEKARVRGYKLTQFEEAFSRYLPPEGDSKCTGAQNAANTGTSDISKPHSPGNHGEGAVDDVPDQNLKPARRCSGRKPR
jgi:hypothetical protein